MVGHRMAPRRERVSVVLRRRPLGPRKGDATMSEQITLEDVLAKHAGRHYCANSANALVGVYVDDDSECQLHAIASLALGEKGRADESEAKLLNVTGIANEAIDQLDRWELLPRARSVRSKRGVWSINGACLNIASRLREEVVTLTERLPQTADF
jgi:hypothetical protein